MPRRARARRHQETRADPQRRQLASERTCERGRWHRTKVGYALVHTAIDGYNRLEYSEVLGDEHGATAAAFWQRAEAFFAAHDITITRVLTDNGSRYRS